MREIIFSDLSNDLQSEIQSNNLLHQRLEIGFYSKVYNLIVDRKIHSYRFHAHLDNDNKRKNTLIFNADVKKHDPYKKNNSIFFFDQELKQTLNIQNDIFENSIIDLQLSDNQKEDLLLGRDITLTVNQQIKSTANNKKIHTASKKTYVADFTFFLGKNTFFLKQQLKVNNSLKMSK